MISRDTLFSGPGGDTVQMKQTAKHLEAMGVSVDICLSSSSVEYNKYDLLHFFNITRVAAILPHLKKSNTPYVISPIFVDYSEYDLLHRKDIIGKITRVFGRDRSEYFKTLARWIKNGESVNSLPYLFQGQRKSIENTLNRASVILPNSKSEFDRLGKAFNFRGKYVVVPNGINKPERTGDNSNNKTGVLCVGRIESYKNQLNIIRALKNSDTRLTIVGKPAPNHISYYEQCKLEAGNNITFLDHAPHDKLVDLYRSHKVHVSASWFETTGLCNLEAALEDCVLVITDKGDTKDYFGDDVYYCDPDGVNSIREQIEKALKSAPSSALKNRILTQYTWENAAKKTLEGYNIALKQNK